ncbi:MAG: GNAT family N-acetyltransferase [Anaeroplasmataceae bacterium]|nr:GNAT family N-acetyltransferase [Anaeroplasmataceae bacterium]
MEAAKAVKQYAFETLKSSKVCSIIRDTNNASKKVAIKNGMCLKDIWIKNYRGIDMPHQRYVVKQNIF